MKKKANKKTIRIPRIKTVKMLKEFLKGIPGNYQLIVFMDYGDGSGCVDDVLSFHLNGKCVQFDIGNMSR